MAERKLTADELTTLRHWFTTGAVDQYPSPGDFKQTLLASASNLLFAEYDRQAERLAVLETSLRELVESQEGQTALDFPGADLRDVAAYERYQAALAQAQQLLLGAAAPTGPPADRGG